MHAINIHFLVTLYRFQCLLRFLRGELYYWVDTALVHHLGNLISVHCYRHLLSSHNFCRPWYIVNMFFQKIWEVEVALSGLLHVWIPASWSIFAWNSYSTGTISQII
jgi:hypothetical protein